jgi:signal transduction histidine kinase
MIAKQAVDKQIFNRLTRLYLIALLAVGLLSLAGQILIQQFLSESLADAHVVNIAGRQRMLSQKLSKTAILISYPNIQNTKIFDFKSELKATISIWENSHIGLSNGKLSSEKTIEVKNSRKINTLFEEINPIFQKIFKNASIIASQNSNPANTKNALFEILQNEPKYLKLMNNIVSEYDFEASKRVNKTKQIELILFLILFGVLIIEGIFIFKPIANNIRLIIKELSASELHLKATNIDLQNTNHALLETKKELIKTTEDKYILQLAEEKVRSFSLIEGQEIERKRFALELHDGIGQMLTGLRLHSEHLKNSKFIDQKTETAFHDLQDLVVDTIEATRAISFNLAPSVLSDFGLVSAIKLLIEKNFKGNKIKANLRSDFDKRLPEKIEIGLYRIVQEAINNALKYANATNIFINLFEKDQLIQMEIIDNGIGFDVEKKPKNGNATGSGINNMITRAKYINANFSIKSEKTIGTKISVKLLS